MVCSEGPGSLSHEEGEGGFLPQTKIYFLESNPEDSDGETFHMVAVQVPNGKFYVVNEKLYLTTNPQHFELIHSAGGVPPLIPSHSALIHHWIEGDIYYESFGLGQFYNGVWGHTLQYEIGTLDYGLIPNHPITDPPDFIIHISGQH